MEKVSVIIPTRNRKESLAKTLSVLSKQREVIHEVIVIDSSDTPVEASELESGFASCVLIHTSASVCAQRNEGIRRATSDFVLVLDDDLSLEENYIARCLAFFRDHPAALIVSGVVLEKNQSGEWTYKGPPVSFFRLAWIFVFQLSLWSDPGETKKNGLTAYFIEKFRRYYQRRGNGISKAGWPLVTQFSQPFFRTQIYFLCASMIRRDWLLANPYTEKFDRHGIGENYGISIGLRPNQGIFLLTETCAYHQRSSENRLGVTDAYYKRVLVLDYFSTLHGSASRKWLVWSLFGNLLEAVLHLRWDSAAKNCRLIGVLLQNRNPLLRQAAG